MIAVMINFGLILLMAAGFFLLGYSVGRARAPRPSVTIRFRSTPEVAGSGLSGEISVDGGGDE